MNTKQFLWLLPFLSFIAGYTVISSLLPAEELVTPSLIGKHLYDACTVLSEKKLNIRILAEQEEPSLPHGTILNQMPAAGQKIKAQQSVFLVISRQPPIARTPHLMGNMRSDIEKVMSTHHNKVTYIYVPSTLPKDYCVAQHPSPDQPSSPTITIYLANGKPFPVVFPNFINSPVDDAVAYLTAQGITPDLPAVVEHDPAHQAIVVDQRPLPGSLITLDAAHPPHVQLSVR